MKVVSVVLFRRPQNYLSATVDRPLTTFHNGTTRLNGKVKDENKGLGFAMGINYCEYL